MRISSLMMYVLLLLSFTVTATAAQQDDAKKNLLANGGFEDGVKGWLYHQWSGKSVPGHLDKEDKFEGTASFKFTDPSHTDANSGRYMAYEVKLTPSDQDYVLGFALSGKDLPDGAGHVRLAIEGKGFLGSQTGKPELAVVSGTQAWKQYGVFVPADQLGEAAKVTIFIYHDKPSQGVLGIDAVSFRPGTADEVPGATAAGTTLRGDTSKAALSTFVLGEPVELNFRVNRAKASESLTLSLAIVDENDNPIESRQVPVIADAEGKWSGTVRAPGDKLGFYRVRATLSNGVALAEAGSRHAGFLTYAVVPDPAQRINYGEQGSRFGMQGGFGPWRDEALAYLGARWILEGNLEWRKREPNHAGEFRADMLTPQSPSDWQTFTLPTLFAYPKWAVVPESAAYMTGTLTPEGEKAWDAYCREAAKAYVALNPSREERIYQITWEPIQPWGFKGTDEDLVRIHEIAYRALHDTDPKAVVAGPCRGINKNEVERTTTILQKGLGKYIDAYSTHPYFSITPERDGMPAVLRAMRQTLIKHSGKDMPMFGTEQGWSTKEDPALDLEHARGLIRQSLITMGEGYRWNMAFYIVDYHLAGQSGYGYYYNLVDGVPWAPAKCSPRPIVPAYAAQSMLLDGHDPVGAIEWLGETAWGYAFQHMAKDEVVLALWDYGSESRKVSILTGVRQVNVYDWMGNSNTVPTPDGSLALTLGPEPVYITGVSPRLWGKSATDRLTVTNRRIDTTPGGRVTLQGSVTAAPDQSLDGVVVIEPDTRLGIEPMRLNVQAGAGKTASFNVEVNVPADAPLSSYPLRLVLQEDGLGTAFTGVRLELLPPVALVSAEPVAKDGQVAGVAFTLAEKRGQATTGTLDVEISRVLPAEQRPDLPMIDLPDGRVGLEPVVGSRQKVRFDIPAGQQQRVTIDLPQSQLQPLSPYHVQATITLDHGPAFTAGTPVSLLVATQQNSAITIDGQLDDWAAIAPIALQGKDAVIRSPKFHSGDSDLAAQVRYTWDKQALRIAIEVTDDTFWQKDTGTNIWRGDSVQLAFDASTNLDVSHHTEITVALTPDGPEVFRHLANDPGKLVLGTMGPHDAQLAVRKTDTGLIYELALTWPSLGVTDPVAASQSINLAMTINDCDTEDQKDPSALGAFGGITPEKDPAKFGRLWLVE